ncbi:RNA polymerase I-specific transcription initiation factor RRN9 [Nakaseomyces bracarensis]|uniref:RNA polymerase I-specific transcription initiation factor RRN9 n=1 Tax=Nakaseomyces bracarensis TaxID=273131 RepID=A0ABR4NZD7_9SACH
MSDLSDSWLGDQSINSDFDVTSNGDIATETQSRGESEPVADETREETNEIVDSNPIPENSSQIIKKTKLTQDFKETVKNANELLSFFEEEQRHDLTLHLYSSFLLKKLLFNAHEKKHFDEIDLFIKTQMRDNWVSWPNPNTIIDPQIDKLYEDVLTNDNGELAGNVIDQETEDYLKKEYQKISDTSLQHARKLMKIELNSHWEHTLQNGAKKLNTNLDIEHTNIPNTVSDKIFNKLDEFLAGMHAKVAKMNKFNVTQDNNDLKLKLIQKDSTIKPNKHIKFDYHDIISRGSEMGDDMRELYMKSLELYNDIPSKFDKNQFKVPPEVLKKYSRPNEKNERRFAEIVGKMKYDYIPLDVIANDKRLANRNKTHLRKIFKKEKENTAAKKSFFYVQGHQANNDSDTEYSDDDYGLDDCLIRIPRKS